MQDSEHYYIIDFTDESAKLPKPTQQRSVLIKNFNGKITNVTKYEKTKWRDATSTDWSAILHFIKNNNNHTKSDWNCIGIRVTPEI
jgi:hypothetical protein